MNYYYHNHTIHYPDHFIIYNEKEEECYTIETKLSWGHFIEIRQNNRLLYTLSDNLSSYLPKFTIKEDDKVLGSVSQIFSFGKTQYDFNYLGYYIKGDFLSNRYSIMYRGHVIGDYSIKHNFVCIQTDSDKVIAFIIALEAFKSLIR